MSLRILWLLLPLFVALAVIPIALAAPPAGEAAPSPSASASQEAPEEAQSTSTPPALPSSFTTGIGPMPNNQRVPTKWLPPGVFEPDTGPSDVVYPPQHITLRFNHKRHLQSDIGATCKTCHAGGTTSTSANDVILPKPQVCDNCHTTSHDNLAKVESGFGAKGQCAFCHTGHKAADGNMVAKASFPRANLVFNHKKHADRNIGCGKCHGAIGELELATRDQLPRMRGCFDCHQMTDSAARGDAKSACETCHVRGVGSEAGHMKTMFASGVLKPPRWLRNSAHTPDFINRHKMVAGNDSQFCANCHSEKYCTDCHDGRVRPRSVHPNDYLSMHPIEARQATQKCTSCHQEQSFCVGCHQRAGVSMSGPVQAKNSGRFHPPKALWSDPPRKPGHHAFEAQRNLNACVSCHIERDCVGCHGAQGVGGGFNPHRGGFVGGCQTQFRRNPRPCFVCHEPSDGALATCR